MSALRVIEAERHGARVWLLVGEMPGQAGFRKVADTYTVSGIRCADWTDDAREAARWCEEHGCEMPEEEEE